MSNPENPEYASVSDKPMSPRMQKMMARIALEEKSREKSGAVIGVMAGSFGQFSTRPWISRILTFIPVFYGVLAILIAIYALSLALVS